MKNQMENTNETVMVNEAANVYESPFKKLNNKWIGMQAGIKFRMEHCGSYLNNEAGMGMIEIALIIIIMVALGVTFKKEITETLEEIFDGLEYGSLSNNG